MDISSKLLYRWQQARLMAEVGSEEVARDPKVRALRAASKRLAQELDMLKKPRLVACYKRRLGQPTR